MYARFYRWASDRLGDEGVVAFVTNRSFLDGRTFDGSRKLIVNDFNEILIVDLGGDVRANPKLSGTKHNVFGIQTGVAIAFLVRRRVKDGATIRYSRLGEFDTAEDKLSWLQTASLAIDRFTTIKAENDGRWLDQIEAGEWPALLPVADKKTKRSMTKAQERAIFQLFSLGVKTNRDDWAVAHTQAELSVLYATTIERYSAFIQALPHESERDWELLTFDQQIKWTRKLRKLAAAKTPLRVRNDGIVPSLYRPFAERPLTFVPELNEDQYQLERIIRADRLNPTIMLNGYPSAKPAQVLATNSVWHHDTLDKTNGLPRYRYTNSGERVDNITDWALAQFVARYGGEVTTPRLRKNSRTPPRTNHAKLFPIALLAKVVRVSLDTVAISDAMRTLDRDKPAI